MKQYDPNPDVNEVLVYSGAGAAAEARRRHETNMILWEASRQTQERWEAENILWQRASFRSDLRFFVALITAVVVFITLFMIVVVNV